MKMLYNKKGIALVILIIAMTLIAILGAGVVSFMGAKQRSYPFQLNSYKALNIANAGVEYAIRIVGDYYNNPEPYIANCYALFPNNWTIKNFGDGQFKICYVGDNTKPDFNMLRSIGEFGGATREIRLNRFMNYASPNSLSRIPYKGPSQSETLVVIPIVNSSGSDITVNEIGIGILFSGNRYLQNIYFTDKLADLYQTRVYDYTKLDDECPATPPPCKDSVNNGIPLSSGVELNFVFNVFNDASYPINTDAVRWCILQFRDTTLTGNYKVEFYYTTSLMGNVTFSLD